MTSVTCNSKESELEKTPKVSVILTVKNEERTIGHAIESVLRIDYPNYEVIMVDTGSEDRTVHIAKQYGIRTIQMNAFTPGKGRNAGIKNSSGEIVAFVDGDCYVSRKDWLKNAVRLFRLDNIGGVSGPVISSSESSYISKALLDVFSTSFASAGSASFARSKKQKDLKSLSSANAIYRRDVLEKVGLFSEDLKFCEDTDLSFRVRKAGFRLVYSPDIVVEHDWKIHSFISLFCHMLKYGAGRAIAGKRHHYLFSFFNTLPSLASICLLLLLLLSFLYKGLFLYSAIVLVVSYSTLALISALLAAYHFRDVKLVVLAPVIYLLVHSGYSIGFIMGLFGRDTKFS
jgi:cellulose synthase/poly-beta-1,6-N-acetylglucosamine synthase-like glycosyltransferase